MKHIVFILFLSFSSDPIFSQKPDNDWENRPSYLILIGGSNATIKVFEVAPSPSYSTADFRQKCYLESPLFVSFMLNAGVLVGMKIKRDSYYYGPTNNYTNHQNIDPRIDAAVSDENRYFIAIPIILEIDPSGFNLKFRAGSMLRAWSPKNTPVDYLSSFKEIGGASRSFNETLSVCH